MWKANKKMSQTEAKTVVCDHAKKCYNFCDGHKIPHRENIFCVRQECMKTGEIVQCVPVKENQDVNNRMLM
jgi:hypothetical protein